MHCLGWNSFANILYIDQPAGTGFSYVSNPDGYVKNDLYIFGESYGKLKSDLLKKCAP